MPSWVSVIRLFRRRLVLGIIFVLSLTYCALNLFLHERKGTLLEYDSDDMIINDNNDNIIGDITNDEESFQSSRKPFLWQMQILNNEGNDNSMDVATQTATNDSEMIIQTCRNSVQGKALIVDERGLVCARQEVLPSGCCIAEYMPDLKDGESRSLIKRERYSCETCNAQGCCAIYEYCVSCCLHPNKIKEKKEAELTRNNQRTGKMEDAVKLRLRNLDRFQVCLATCRTSSASVRHENTYKNPHSKHCYNLQPPGNAYFHQRYRRDLISINNNDDNLDVVVTPSSAVPLLAILLFLSFTVFFPFRSPRLHFDETRTQTFTLRERNVTLFVSVRFDLHRF